VDEDKQNKMSWLKPIFIVAVWYGGTALASITTKLALARYQDKDPWVFLDLTFYQCVVGIAMAYCAQQLRRIKLDEPFVRNAKNSAVKKPFPLVQSSFKQHSNTVPWVALFHCIGNILTNVSIGLIGTTGTQVLKAAEPLCTVVVAYFLLGTLPNRKTMAALVMICGGVMLATATRANISIAGASLVLISNFCLPLRNVYAKRCVSAPSSSSFSSSSSFRNSRRSAAAATKNGCGSHKKSTDHCSLYYESLVYSFPYLVILTLVKIVATKRFAFDLSFVLSSLLSNSYQIASFLLLELVDPLMHSVANVFKRLFSIACSVAYFGEAMTLGLLCGLDLAFTGLLLYSQSNSATAPAAKRRPIGCSMNRVLVCLGYLAKNGIFCYLFKSRATTTDSLTSFETVVKSFYKAPLSWSPSRLLDLSPEKNSSKSIAATSSISHRIFSVHLVDEKNIGDMLSTPLHYFSDLAKATTAVLDVRENSQENIVKYNMTKDDMVIVGGGGLLNFSDPWTDHIYEYCKASRCILWSPGYNRPSFVDRRFQPFPHPNASTIGSIADVVSLRDVFPLSKIKDLGYSYEHMLDASCLHPLLDLPCDNVTVRKTGFYLHKKHVGELTGNNEESMIGNTMFNNETDASKVFGFLCASESIVTTSYHGILWATYLNKTVWKTAPHSEKFSYLPLEIADWPGPQTQANDGIKLRDICRRQNQKFYAAHVQATVERILESRKREERGEEEQQKVIERGKGSMT
jgi:drug/metabolite transporter (DMT)-like permease